MSARSIAQATQTQDLLGHFWRWRSPKEPTQTEEGLGAAGASQEHARHVRSFFCRVVTSQYTPIHPSPRLYIIVAAFQYII